MNETKRCAQCGRVFDVVFFRRNPDSRASALARDTRAICKGCEQTARDQLKAIDRWPKKVDNMIRWHARRFGIGVRDLVDRYGWDPKQIAHEAKHAYANGCPYCQFPFETMGHGIADLSIDIVNPDSPPWYTTNTKFCCVSCNREKHRTPPELWSRLCVAWKQWTNTSPVGVAEQLALF
jgi:hypothetical protein